MAELSKNQLKSDNNLDFPNNNIGAITPATLRSFNADMIDSTVNQTIYTADSASWTNDIDVLQAFSASQYNLNRTLATTGSNTFVGNQIVSGTVFTNALDTTTGNTLTIYSDLDVSGSFVSNLQAGYVWLGSTNGRAVAVPSSSIAAGGSTDLSALNAFTASQNTKNSTLASYTGSNDTKWNTLGGLTGSFATTGSNTFVATQTINADLIVSGTINAYKINTTIESSSVIFSSGSNILGDSTSDTQTLNGTVIVSGSQRITGSTSTTDTITINKSGGNGLVVPSSGIAAGGTITGANGIYALNSNVISAANTNNSGSQYPGFTAIVSAAETPTDVYGGFSINNSAAETLLGVVVQSYSTEYGAQPVPMIFGGTNYNGSATAIGLSGSVIDLWKPTNVKSGLSITGSVGITGSATITGTTTITGSVGISGNQTIGGTQTITGAQTLNGNGNVVSGSINFNGTARFNNTASLYNTIRLNNNISPDTNFLTVDVASGSIVLQSPNAGGGISGLAHLSSSAVSTQVNLVFKNSTTAADTIISGSNNIFVNQSAPTAGFKRYFGGSGNIALQNNAIQITGSMGFSPTMNNNIWNGSAGISMRGPASSSAWTISNNIGANSTAWTIGTAAGTPANQLISGFNATGNVGSLNPAITAYKTPLSASVAFTNNNGSGQISMNCDSSSISFANNLTAGSTTINNSYFPSTVNSNASIALSNSTIFGTSTTINASGSDTTFTAVAPRGAFNNIIGGYSTIGLVLNGDNSSLNSSAIVGGGLVVTGSNSKVAGATANADFGSAFFGRWNDVNGNRALSGPTVFAVGTGTSTSLRKTAFLIDSGSNTFVEGTLNVSGSTSMTGSLSVNGSTIVSGSVRGNVLTQTIISTTASFDFSTANFFELTLVNATNTRVEATNVQPGQTINVLVKQASSPGNGTISFSSAFDFPAVSPYTASVIADAKDILTFVTFANTGSIYAAAVKNLI